MSTTATIRATSVRLDLNTSPELVRRYGKQIKAMRGRYSEARGHTSHRHINLPLTPEGIALGDKLLAEFASAGKTTVVLDDVEGVGDSRGNPLPTVFFLAKRVALASLIEQFDAKVAQMVTKGMIVPRTIYTEAEKRDQELARLRESETHQIRNLADTRAAIARLEGTANREALRETLEQVGKGALS